MAILGGWRLTRTGALFLGGVIILGAILIGVIYFVSQHAEQARRDEAVKIAEQNLQQQSQEVAQEANNEANKQTVQEEPSAPQRAESNRTELPQTGGELSAVIVIAILALAAAYYASSRRAIRQL